MKHGIVLGLTLAFIAGCSSGNTEGGETDFDQFSSDGDTSGRVELELNDDRVDVASTTGFRFFAEGVDGPTPNLSVVCDTERGLALIEPTTGTELTDSNGQMSGRVGCVSPGSFQIACRVAGGANKRVFKTVVCSGDIPTGFDGFSGSGGGTLGSGGGVDGGPGSPGGGDPSSAVRVTNVQILDQGDSTTGIVVDAVQSICFTGEAPDAVCTDEPFFDTRVAFTVSNQSNTAVRFTSYSFRIPGVVQASALAFNGVAEVSPGASATIQSFIAAVFRGTGAKRFAGSSTTIGATLNERNVTFTLNGTNDEGEDFTLTFTRSISFGTYIRCPSGSNIADVCPNP